MMKQQIVSAILLLCPVLLVSQVHFEGKVTDKAGKALHGAHLQIAGTDSLQVSDAGGYFQFSLAYSHKLAIIISHTGYKTDTFTVSPLKFLNIVLSDERSIDGVTVKGSRKDSYIDNQAVKTEVISQGELKKAACCDLAGCFETQGTVQPMTTNIITNSKELRILGLSGVYNQVLVDGMPMIQGLTYTYGISSIPGTLVDNIYVAKGTTSVLQGFESIVGQINVITKNPARGERLFLNAYANSFGESQYNVNYRLGKKKWQHLLSAHMVQPAQKWDRDQDGFLDLPLLTRYLLFDKVVYGDDQKKGFSTMFSARYLWEQRNGGQKQFDPASDLGSNRVYGQQVKLQQPEIYTKSGYRFSAGQKLTLIASAFDQQQHSWFGTVKYDARQQNAYANLQYEKQWHSNHELKTGISYRYLNLQEDIGFSDTSLKRTYAGNYGRTDQIPGLFAENTFKWKADIITLITGVRADHHNIYGWKITPRAMLKYDVTEKATVRASAGTGWRAVNLFSENIGLLVSSRNIVFRETPGPESAFNWGINLLQKFTRKHAEGFFTVDFYQTRFRSQFFPDYDTDPGYAYIANFRGTSVSNGFQADFNTKLYKVFEVKTAYNFLDVYRVINNVKRQLPFNARHKVLLSLSYVPKQKKWRGDCNIHWFGSQRLPDTEMNPEEFRQPHFSKPYTTVSVQVTKSWKAADIYAGCENLFDYRQLKPIVSWQNPFSPYFDSSFNWGPTRGREIYMGIRFKMFDSK